MTDTCAGCLHERNGRCAWLPKQFAGQIPSVHWSWPPADERCGQYTTAELRAAAADEVTGRVVGQVIDRLREATGEPGGA